MVYVGGLKTKLYSKEKRCMTLGVFQTLAQCFKWIKLCIVYWSIIYCLTSCLRCFHLYGGIFIVPHLLWHGASVFRISPKDRPTWWPFATRNEIRSTYFNPNPQWSPFSRLLQAWGCWGPYSHPNPHESELCIRLLPSSDSKCEIHNSGHCYYICYTVVDKIFHYI
jgi:hypothetical protein